MLNWIWKFGFLAAGFGMLVVMSAFAEGQLGLVSFLLYVGGIVQFGHLALLGLRADQRRAACARRRRVVSRAA